mgnify:CR=1 FL=1|tara:strand:+ start:3417 stop:4142 length:726 start_codon:yes stop_codon:yes gene_type:complete
MKKHTKRRKKSRQIKKNKISRKNISRNKSIGGSSKVKPEDYENIEQLVNTIVSKVTIHIGHLLKDFNNIFNELLKNVTSSTPPAIDIPLRSTESYISHSHGGTSCIGIFGENAGHRSGKAFGELIANIAATRAGNLLLGIPNEDKPFVRGIKSGLMDSFTSTLIRAFNELLKEDKTKRIIVERIETKLREFRIKIRDNILENVNKILENIRVKILDNLLENVNEKFKPLNPYAFNESSLPT